MSQREAGPHVIVRAAYTRAAVALCAASVCGAAGAEQLVVVSGTNTWESVPTQAAVSDGAPKDAPVFVSSLKGKSKETSQSGLFDGATLYDTGIGEVAGSRLLLSSVSRGEKAGEIYYFRNEGVCDIFNAGTSNEATRCNGTWSLIPGGTGKFATMRGSGTWRSRVAADGSEFTEWDGVVSR